MSQGNARLAAVMAAAAVGCGTSCFVGAVRVATPEGPRRIDGLAVGDRVLAFDTGAREVVIGVVTALHRARAVRLGRIGVAGRVIDGVTEDHPFYDPEAARWVRAADLAAGAPVVVRAGDGSAPARVSEVGWRDEDADVFNLSVSGPETYFVEDVLVHNKSEGCTTTAVDSTAELPLDEVELHSGRVPLEAFAEVAATTTRTATWEDGSTVELTLGLGTTATTASQEYSTDSCGFESNWLRFPVTLTFATADGSFDEVWATECLFELGSAACYIDIEVDWAALQGRSISPRTSSPCRSARSRGAGWTPCSDRRTPRSGGAASCGSA